MSAPSDAPVTYSHGLIVGDTYSGPIVTFADDAGTPYDLTGVVGEVTLRRTLGGEIELQPAVDILDAEAGELTWSSPPEDTAALAPGAYLWALRLTWPDETVKTYLVGTITATLTAAGV